MLNGSLESFCTLSWDNSDVLTYRTGQSFKIVLCVCQPERCFVSLVEEKFK